LGGRCCEFLCTKTHLPSSISIHTSLKAICGIFLPVTHIRFKRKIPHQTVLSSFSSSTRGIFQKTPRSCSLIGLLMFQNLYSPRILEWMATYKPLTTFLKVNSIYFPVRCSNRAAFEMRKGKALPCLVLAQPPPRDINKDVVIPNNTPHPFTFQLSKVPAVKKIGGSVKVVDTRTFTVSEKISAAEVEIDVGGMR